MRKIIILFLCMTMGFAVLGQNLVVPGSYWEYANKRVPFGRKFYPNDRVRLTDSAKTYSLTIGATSHQTMNTIFNAGTYIVVPESGTYTGTVSSSWTLTDNAQTSTVDTVKTNIMEVGGFGMTTMSGEGNEVFALMNLNGAGVGGGLVLLQDSTSPAAQISAVKVNPNGIYEAYVSLSNVADSTPMAILSARSPTTNTYVKLDTSALYPVNTNHDNDHIVDLGTSINPWDTTFTKVLNIGGFSLDTLNSQFTIRSGEVVLMDPGSVGSIIALGDTSSPVVFLAGQKNNHLAMTGVEGLSSGDPGVFNMLASTTFMKTTRFDSAAFWGMHDLNLGKDSHRWDTTFTNRLKVNSIKFDSVDFAIRAMNGGFNIGRGDIIAEGGLTIGDTSAPVVYLTWNHDSYLGGVVSQLSGDNPITDIRVGTSISTRKVTIDTTSFWGEYTNAATRIKLGREEHPWDTTFISSIKMGSTNTVTVDPTNALRLYGTATVWDDLFFPFSTGVRSNVSYPPLVPDSGYYQFTVDTTGGSKCIMYFTFQIPHNYAAGTNLHPHIHYRHNTTAADSAGTPTFVLKYKWFNIGSASGSYSWIRMGTPSATTNNTHQMVEGSEIPGTGKTLSSILVAQLYLRSSTGVINPINAKCDAWQFDIHYQIDALGSKDELLK